MKQAIAKVKFKGAYSHHGTAWLFSHEYALTAAHCVADRKKCELIDQQLVLQFPWGKVATEVHDYDCDLDVAILAVKPWQIPEGTPVFNLGVFPHSLLQGTCPEWEADGYARARKTETLRLHGTIVDTEGVVDGTRAYQLTCAIGGLRYLEKSSGAAVCYANSAIGVIRWAPPALKQKVIYATPIDLISKRFPAVAAAFDRSSEKIVVATTPQIEAFERVRRFSEIAARDARLIVEDVTSHGNEEIRLDQNLYVSRVVEAKIQEILDSAEQESQIIVLVGEAGHGKTSLLWHLYQSFNHIGREAWFIKSSWLLRHFGRPLGIADNVSASTLAPSDLADAVRLSRSKGSRPFILLDTVDLLLHSAEDRDSLLSLLTLLKENGCSVIASCRPQESWSLSTTSASVILERYNESELAEAVERHAARFYGTALPSNEEENLRQIREAVTRGLPLREVCENPLTLRMLFMLYRPERVSSEINIFGLYKEYWARRVKSDLRAGNPLAAANSRDLSRSAEAVALVMLAEGTPEPGEELLRQTVSEFGGVIEEVNELIARSVLQKSEIGTVSFFHQTFFEHSAARGLVARFAAEGLKLLHQRLQERPNDLFVSPVLEQAILLAENEKAPVRKRADEVLEALLVSEEIVLKTSGVYVYLHQPKPAQATVAVMRKILLELEGEDYTPIERFLHAAPNIAKQRVQSLLDELSLIWRRGQWREQEHILELLERLAARDASATRKFIETHDILEFVVNKPPAGFPGDRKLLLVAAALAEQNPNWSWKLMIQLYEGGLRRTNNRDFHVAIVNTIKACSRFFGRKGLASRFTAAIAGLLEERYNRGFDDLVRAYAKLWLVEWGEDGHGVTEILADLDGMKDGLVFRAKQKALCERLLTASKSEAEQVFTYFTQIQSPANQFVWMINLLVCVLQGGDEIVTRLAEAPTPPAVEYFRRATAQILNEWAMTPMTDCESQNRKPVSLPQWLIKAIREAQLQPQSLKALLTSPALLSPAIWLEVNRFYPLIADAYVAGHPGAVQAVELMLKSPENYAHLKPYMVSSRLARFTDRYPVARDLLVSSTLAFDDAQQLFQTIKEQTFPPPVSWQQKTKELEECRRRLTASRSEADRQLGALLWEHLLRLRLCSPPPFEELRRLLKGENDAQTHAQLVVVMGEAATQSAYELSTVVTLLLPLAAINTVNMREGALSDAVNMREKALTALMKVLIESPADPAPFAEQSLEAALSVPSNSARLGIFRRLIERLALTDLSLSLKLYERIATEAERAGVGREGRRRVSNRLEKAVRKLIRHNPAATVDFLLGLVPRVDGFFGRMIIEAICLEAYDQAVDKLDGLLSVPGIDTEVTRRIMRNKYYRQRPLGNDEGWPELYDLYGAIKAQA